MIMIKLTVTPKDKPSFNVYFKTVEDCRSFAEFMTDVISGVKKKTLQELGAPPG